MNSFNRSLLLFPLQPPTVAEVSGIPLFALPPLPPPAVGEVSGIPLIAKKKKKKKQSF